MSCKHFLWILDILMLFVTICHWCTLCCLYYFQAFRVYQYTNSVCDYVFHFYLFRRIYLRIWCFLFPSFCSLKVHRCLFCVFSSQLQVLDLYCSMTLCFSIQFAVCLVSVIVCSFVLPGGHQQRIQSRPKLHCRV